MANVSGKVCVICGIDCASKPRTKDSKGRYYCKDCYDKAVRRKQASASPRAAAPPVEGIDARVSANVLDQIVDSIPSLEARSGRECPSCGDDIATGAILCTNCGFNTQTGSRLRIEATPHESSGRSFNVPALGGLMSPTVVALAIAVVLGGLLFLAVNNQNLLLAYAGVELAISLGVLALVLAFAFKESIGTGLLTLCVPCYIFYFVYGICDNPWVRSLFGVSVVMRIISVVVLRSTGGFDEAFGI